MSSADRGAAGVPNMSDQTFERAALDGKDREQLQAIATAVGVKGVSRMKKADLVEAIVTTAGTPSPSTSSRRAKAEAAPASASTRHGGAAPAGEKRAIR